MGGGGRSRMIIKIRLRNTDINTDIKLLIKAPLAYILRDRVEDAHSEAAVVTREVTHPILTALGGL